MGKEDKTGTAEHGDSLTAHAIGQALAAALAPLVAGIQGAQALSPDALADAIGRVMRSELRPTTADRQKEIERPVGPPRFEVAAVSPSTGAKFTAVLRPDGTCEKIDNYEYPDFKWEQGFSPYEHDDKGRPTDKLSRIGKQRIYNECLKPDLLAYVSRTEPFPMYARADMQDKMHALKEQIAAAAQALTAASDVKAGE